MTTITIAAITHRESCVNQSDPRDAVAYDNNAPEFFAELAVRAAAEGFELKVDPTGAEPCRWVVHDCPDVDTFETAHQFMDRDENGFWAWFYGVA